MSCDYRTPFSHIYIEEEALQYPATARILEYFKNRDTVQIPIRQYQEVFHRKHQSFAAQKHSPSLILAVKHGNLIYPGAKVCQSFGNAHFYYTSFVMNCPFDCEYCYLQGMYSSAHIVIFVNLEDFFTETKKLLVQHPVYLCISYDTDLLALEPMTGFLTEYLAFAAELPELTTELRTKSACRLSRPDGFSAEAAKRFILAYTLSPDYVATNYEHRTAPLAARLKAAIAAHQNGFPIRLCFDPMLRFPGYEAVYTEFFTQVREALRDIPILDASVGVFRISDTYLKQMRKHRPDSAVLAYPFETVQQVCHYGSRSADMIQLAINCLADWIPEEKIFTIED
ncbi:MAG: radical SAM protein [Lachnospiraceae bacterium]|nr:radical SAM protein [Lachnospiraceae bacterium]